jgi:hypothetical protein
MRCLLLAMWVLLSAACQQAGRVDVAAPGKASSLPCLRVRAAPPLDGRHAGVWLTAPKISRFYQIVRAPGRPTPADAGDLRLLADEQFLYLSMKMRDRDLLPPAKQVTVAGSTLRYDGDVLEVFLWPRAVVPRAYAEIHVYPGGETWQAMHLDRKENPHAWAAPVRAISRVQAGAKHSTWTVQMAIPWSSLTRADAQPSASSSEFGMLVTRIDAMASIASAQSTTRHLATAPLSTLWFHMIEQYGQLRLISSASEAEWLE